MHSPPKLVRGMGGKKMGCENWEALLLRTEEHICEVLNRSENLAGQDGAEHSGREEVKSPKKLSEAGNRAGIKKLAHGYMQSHP